MTERQKTRQITKLSPSSSLSNNPQSDPISLTQLQLIPILNQLRLLSGSVHTQQSTNLPKAFTLYLRDISLHLSQLSLSLQKQQSTIRAKQHQISELKLMNKGAKNDFAEMKSSLILEMEEQRTVVEHLKEEMRLERERLNNTVRQLMEEGRWKDQEMFRLREESEEEVKRVRQRASVPGKTDQYQESRKRVNTVYDRQKVQLVKSQDMKKQQQTQQFLGLLKDLKIDVKTAQSQEIITYVENLFSRVRELQLNMLERQQEIDTQVSFSYLTTSKTQQNDLILVRKQEQIQDIKDKVAKLNRSIQSKQTQNNELRCMIEKYLKQKEENNKYLGTKWQHEIERVMLNAEVEFDRQKNRIKRAGQERLAEVERMMGDKIRELREENRNIRENKLKKAIERIRQLEDNIKQLQQQKTMAAQTHKHQSDQLKKSFSNLSNQYDQLSTLHKTSLTTLQQEKLRTKQISHQLQYIKLTLKEKQIQLQSQNKKVLDIQKIQLQQEKDTFITTSKNTYQEIVRKFQEEQMKREIEQQELFSKKYQELFGEVSRCKREYQELCEVKVRQVTEEKEDLKKVYEKMMRAAKQEERNRQEQLTKMRTKLNSQIKQLKDQINKKQQQLLKNKQQMQSLSKDRKNTTHTVRIKGQQISSLVEQIKSKQQQYNQLQSLYHSLSRSNQQLQFKYSTINEQIIQLKNYFLKEHSALKQQHIKTERNYRAYIKDIEDACFSSSDRNIYIREIRRLKLMNDGVETNLKNAENKLVTMKELSKYQGNKIERMQTSEKERDREEYTYRSEEKLKADYRAKLNFTERRGTETETGYKEEIRSTRKRDRNNSTASLYRLYDMESSKDMLREKEKEKQKEKGQNSTRYLKLSKIKAKTKNHFYQQNRFKKSKVGLAHIDNYTQFESQRENFKLLASPRLLTSFRTEVSKEKEKL